MSSKNSSLDLLVEIGGTLYVQDPESGALLPAMLGAQDLEYLDTSFDYDPSSYGSYDASSYDIPAPVYNTPTPDILGSQGQYYGNQANLGTGWIPNPSAPFSADQYANPAASINSATGLGQLMNSLGLAPGGTGTPSGGVGGTGTGGGFFSNPLGGGAGGAGGGFGGLGVPGLLGLGGGLAGLIGALTAGGKTGSQTPIMSVPQRAAGNAAYDSLQGLQQFAQGQSPAQQMQMSLLQSLAGGQINPGLQRLIQQAYQVPAQSLMQQATEAGRASGFADAPATSPAGGAVLGPGLAQLQGQEANSLLQAMYQIPGMFQAPIDTQVGAAENQASGFSNLMRGYPYGTQNSVPFGNQVFQGIAGTLGGLGQGMAQNQNQQTQQNWQNQMLQAQNQQNANFQQLLGLQRIGAVPGGQVPGPVASMSGSPSGGGSGYSFYDTYGGPSGGNG